VAISAAKSGSLQPPQELAHRDQTSDSEQLASKDGQEVSQTEHEAEIQRPMLRLNLVAPMDHVSCWVC
jgi:hypothetical protein